MPGVIQYGDEAEKYLVAQSVIKRLDFSFRPTVMRNEAGAGGRRETETDGSAAQRTCQRARSL